MPNHLEAFLEHVPEQQRDALAQDPALQQKLDDALADGRACHPDVILDDELFLRYLAERLPEEGAEPLAMLRHADLYLACACAEGQTPAIATFRTSYCSKIEAAVANVGLGGAADEVAQRVLTEVLMPATNGKPTICKYGGRGALSAWVTVTAVRVAQRQAKKRSRERVTDDDRLFDCAMPLDDPELRHLKELYRDQFKQAFHKAFETLTARERNIIRYQLVGGMNIDQIGAIYGVHRATVARWRHAGREKLLRETSRIFRDDHGLSGTEFDSVMRLIRSQLDVSLPRLLTADQAGS